MFFNISSSLKLTPGKGNLKMQLSGECLCMQVDECESGGGSLIDAYFGGTIIHRQFCDFSSNMSNI